MLFHSDTSFYGAQIKAFMGDDEIKRWHVYVDAPILS